MHIQVDQSGKIERTQRNTAPALSNEIEYTVLFLGVEKRESVARLRQRGESGNKTTGGSWRLPAHRGSSPYQDQTLAQPSG